MGDDPSVDDEFPAPHPARFLPRDCPFQAIVLERAAEADRFRSGDVHNLNREKQAGQDGGVILAGCCTPIRSWAHSEHGFV
jgi:hypothetical protein